MRFLVLALVVLAAVALTSEAQSEDVPTTCQEARQWHLAAAMRFSLRDEQDFHRGAAWSAEELDAYGWDACEGWEMDSHGPLADGRTDAEALDEALEAQDEEQAQRVGQ